MTSYSRAKNVLLTGMLAYITLNTGCGHWVFVKNDRDLWDFDDKFTYTVYRNEDDNTCRVTAWENDSCAIDYPYNDLSCDDFPEVNFEFINKLISECEGRPYFPPNLELKVSQR